MSPAIEIGPARRHDAEAIARMSRDLIETGLPWSWRAQRVRRVMSRYDTIAIVARQADAIVGLAIMQFRRTRAHLALFAVQPSHRRQGVGRRLLAWLETCALDAGIEVINLEVRLTSGGARAFYGRLGYREVRELRGYYRGTESAMRMTRRIRPPVAIDVRDDVKALFDELGAQHGRHRRLSS